jgi:hypothetical protein
MPAKIIATHSVQFNSIPVPKRMFHSALVICKKLHYVELYQSSNSDISDSIANWLSEEIAFACFDFPS